MNWNEILDGTDPQRLKDQLSLAAVVQAHGVALRPAGERLVGLCPFHDDHDASFAVWRTEDGDELCGCWSCDFRPGDLFSFLQRAKDVRFGDALQLAANYQRDGLPEAPPIPDSEPDPDAPQRIRSTVESTEGQGIDLLAELMFDKGHPATPEWVAEEFRVGTTGRSGEVVIPHYARSGALEAAKWRNLERKPIAYGGSQLNAMYGEWRDLGRTDVVVCEGESDTWAVAWMLRDAPVDVLGVPSGVTSKPRPQWIDPLKGRTVTILFDADPAGRRGVSAWVNALSGVADEIRVAMLPEGEDAVSAGQDETIQALRSAWPATTPPAGGLQRRAVYAKDRQDGTPVDYSDFVLDVQQVVETEDDTIFEVTNPHRADGPWQLHTSTVIDPNKLSRWVSGTFLGVWKGGRRENAELLGLLKSDAVDKPRYKGTEVVGLHGHSFVLPDRVIGPAGWAFVEPTRDTGFGRHVTLNESEWDPRVLSALSQMHAPDVITPLLGWVAAAPLRSLCRQFPIMALVGGAGWGKTVTAQTVLSAFGFWGSSPTTLTSSTPFAIGALSTATNAFPLWVDEYRLGARKETKEFLDQLIRDAWDGSSSFKGNVKPGGGLELVSYTASAPLLITGEDGFTEKSHAERMVILPMPMEGRDPMALSTVLKLTSPGLGHAYLSWLVARMRSDQFAMPPVLNDRHRQAIAVVRWGWDMLYQFAGEVGVDIGTLDLSRAEREYEEMSNDNPYVMSLREALNHSDNAGNPIVWVEGDDICFRPLALVSWANSNGITLPGRTRAMNAWLRERWRMSDNSSRTVVRSARLHGAAPDVCGP